MKKIKNIPDAPVILIFIMLLAVIMTWIIPGGEISYDSENDLAQLQFKSVPHNAFKLWQLPSVMIEAASASLSVIIVCAMGNCLVHVANSKGAFNNFINLICFKKAGKEEHLVVIFTVFFALLGFVVPPQCFIGFTATMVTLSVSMGYDSILGLAMVMLSVACSAMTGPLNSITAIAQAQVGLPIYSGILVRFGSFVLFLTVTIIYFVAYARKIKKDRAKSFMYGMENTMPKAESKDAKSIDFSDKAALFIVIAIFAVIAVGSMANNWSANDISAVMLTGTVLLGFTMRYNLSKIFSFIVEGVKELTGMYLVIILANTVGIILKNGNILDTIIYQTSECLQCLPKFIIPTGIMVFICIMNVILPSGAGKAVMLMPIISPIGQAVGMSAQTSVLAYTFGDGFSNYIIPHDSSTISYLNAAGVPYTIWLKFMGKLFAIWCILGAVILTTLYYTGYGPF